MTTVGWCLLGLAIGLGVYTYVGYPLLLGLMALFRSRGLPKTMPDADWPRISITIPAYNEERQIGATLDSVLALDYPADRRQIVVVSDASTDRTDEIVRSYADRGVELLRQTERAGKTAAENLAADKFPVACPERGNIEL